MQELLEKIYSECLLYTGKGKVADYIPELKKVNSNLFGVSIIEDGKEFHVGDSLHKFSIQSVSKVLIFMQAIFDNGAEEVLKKVTLEPTSSSFNSIVNLELKNNNKPLNPFINAGAIVCVSFVKGQTAIEKVDRIINLIKLITKNDDVFVNEDVYLSEKKTGSRNKALAYYMNSTGILDDDVEMVLDAYFRICAIELTCKDLAMIAYVIAKDGMLDDGTSLFNQKMATQLRAVMALCGMYDASGDFAVRVGLPSKSGVGGGILSVSLIDKPRGIAVFSPALDEKGNSYAGVRFLQKLSHELNLSIF